jgi:hypothetical protein
MEPVHRRSLKLEEELVRRQTKSLASIPKSWYGRTSFSQREMISRPLPSNTIDIAIPFVHVAPAASFATLVPQTCLWG